MPSLASKVPSGRCCDLRNAAALFSEATSFCRVAGDNCLPAAPSGNNNRADRQTANVLNSMASSSESWWVGESVATGVVHADGEERGQRDAAVEGCGGRPRRILELAMRDRRELVERR